jgi:hypothetical protein
MQEHFYKTETGSKEVVPTYGFTPKIWVQLGYS